MSAFLFVTPTWDGQAWATHMRKALPLHDVRVWPDMGNLDDLHYVAAWLPPANVVKSLPNLKVIFSLGAGVDAILSDPSLPQDKPIVRVNDPDLTMRMSEHVVMQVLMHHRQQLRLNANQQAKIWDCFPQHAASSLRVGVMGLGVLGADAARKLAVMGFPTAGWSRTRKHVEGVESYSGAGELDAFLARTDVLVCLLPATAETDGILNAALIRKLSRNGPFGAPVIINAGRGRQQVEEDILAALESGALHGASLDVFRKLSRNGPFGAPVIINAGRGRQQVEEDILAALESGALHGASLDVFRKEPLPPESPFWHHPKVILSPHSAADSDPATICHYVAHQIGRFERDSKLENLVDRSRGY